MTAGGTLTCPLDCGADLHIAWTASRPLFRSDLTEPEPPAPGERYVASWTVVCEEGHTVLVPGTGQCGHSDGCECPDNEGDEVRTFRRVDLLRLGSLIARIGRGAAEPPAAFPNLPCDVCHQRPRAGVRDGRYLCTDCITGFDYQANLTPAERAAEEAAIARYTAEAGDL